MWILRVFSSVTFLFTIILSVPLAFDVGGRACGLAFSLSLASFYFYYSVLRLATPPSSRYRWLLIQLLSWLQWAVVPSLLIWSLNRFSVEPVGNSSWVERTFSGKRSADTSVWQWIFGPDGLAESITVGGWDKTLRWSTPVFQLVEGFCSLLVIQAAGQITRWLVNRSGRSDSWMIGLLVVSASVISSAVYFLWRVTRFPEISNVDATLIGITITCAVFLCAWGIGSGKGNPVESSLLFAYVVLCIYQIFTDYQPSTPEESPPPPQAPDFPPFPPIIMASYTTLMQAVSVLPGAIHAGFNFIADALSTVTPSVLISLAYRLFVLYATTRIVPAIRESGVRGLSEEPTLEDSDGAGQVLGLLSWFSPSILITVYTSLLMQHFSSMSGDVNGEWWKNQGGHAGSNLWRWVNLALTMAMYALELQLNKEDLDGGLTTHWKAD
ncbi:uncharacterized protein KY384_006893 [Bacidia gigantensis]|uniref:uncharacterized protein n=1 Tax=Bacidia gigantensis TaxID=2732470 RepID=UPI001D04C34C|nr:uncharacterized protein KY384_006893 [Bacidia gigantensis]KAG8527977.1 hypothetical protein KY384_006893 [Bacidia gigantensis]